MISWGSVYIRRRQWHPTPVLLPGKSHGWRSVVGYSPRDHKESDMPEQLHFHFQGSWSRLKYCITKMWDRDTRWTNAIRNIALIDLPNAGLPKIFNLKKMKYLWNTKKQSTIIWGMHVNAKSQSSPLWVPVFLLLSESNWGKLPTTHLALITSPIHLPKVRSPQWLPNQEWTCSPCPSTCQVLKTFHLRIEHTLLSKF